MAEYINPENHEIIIYECVIHASRTAVPA